MKGGYWKNSEDEILKAAVMKYGLNQWARIASLMSRKSVKQCKARWYEWLDPSIKKTDWTREEEERLIHLAKLFPAQWRTIAPMLNRTPQMCIEHYERLMDMTLGRQYDEENDPRKLLPGEIDALAEHRPARADPVDMDDDEKEMIAEARVRIANRKGKKEKRKARERVLEEARRLATIQKFRELRNAGVDFVIERKPKKKVKEFSYDGEIPLERQPLEQAFGVPEEERARAQHSDANVANISLAELEGQRREDMEAKKRADDAERVKRLKAKNLPGKILRKQVNDPTEIYGREPLVLEEPQLKDQEIEEICKLKRRSSSQWQRSQQNTATDTPRSQEEESENKQFQCTDVLLPDADFESFDNIVSRIRTPKASLGIMQQAREMMQINDPKSALDTSTVLDNRSVSMAPSLAKSRVSTPNPLKQLILDYHKNRDVESRYKGDTEYHRSVTNFGGPETRLSNADGRSLANLSLRDSDPGTIFRRMEQLTEGQNRHVFETIGAENEQILQNLETSDKQLKAQEKAFLRSIFQSLPEPVDAYKVDFDDLQRQYKEAIGEARAASEESEEDVMEVLLPPLSKALKEELRSLLLSKVSADSNFLASLSPQDESLFFALCSRLKIQVDSTVPPQNQTRSTSSRIQTVNDILEERCKELLESQSGDLLAEMTSEILKKCRKNIA